MKTDTILLLGGLAVLGIGGFFAVRALQSGSKSTTTPVSNPPDKNGVFGSGISAESAADVLEGVFDLLDF